MLNYIWAVLLFLGIGTAIFFDVKNEAEDKFRNGKEINAQILFQEINQNKSKAKYHPQIKFPKKIINQFYDIQISEDIILDSEIIFNDSKKNANVILTIGNNSPKIWKEIAKSGGDENQITGKIKIISWQDSVTANSNLILEKVSFIKLKNVTNSAINYAKIAVNIALGLIGIMALWLGVMKVAEEAGLIKIIANSVKPITKFLFPEIPQDHPAIGAIIMNLSANMLGLGNAATPFGLKAMDELEKLNPNKGVATNAMCTFLAMNTAGLTLIPATAIAVRAASGSSDPAIIIGTSIFGASCATIVGIIAAKILEKFPLKLSNSFSFLKNNTKVILATFVVMFLFAIAIVTGIVSSIISFFNFINPELFKTVVQTISAMAIPALILIFIGFGFAKKVKVYESFVEGAKEGFQVAVKIIPFLVGMLVAIGIFRAGGAMELFQLLLSPITNFIGMPADVLPIAIMRPLSGSGSLGIMTEIIATHGPDSFIGILASTIFGSTETTFYVLAVYFGAINIKKTRHALAAGLLADIAGVLGALFIVKLLFG